MKLPKIMVISLVLAMVSFSFAETVKDRDGNIYPTVKIGEQLWMAKNLNVKVNGSMCYDNNPFNCEKYGRLYTWEAAQKVCPSGWHLPSEKEFEILLESVGSNYEERSVNLRALSWENGQDKFGFSALPAGHYNGIFKEFYNLGRGADFWSSTEYDEDFAYDLYIHDLGASVSDFGGDIFYYDKGFGKSVRCVKGIKEGINLIENERYVLMEKNFPKKKENINEDNKEGFDYFVDVRDGKSYKMKQIGQQTWMAENLNVKTEGSWCYNNDPDNCVKYGRLYTWEAAKKVCPDGWHLPSKEEFEILLEKIGLSGGENVANLRVPSWNNGEDRYGFSALLAGYYNASSKEFYYLGSGAYFWSSTENDGYDAYSMDYFNVDEAGVYYSLKNNGFSVRCLKESENADLAGEDFTEESNQKNIDENSYSTVKIGNQEWMTQNLNIKTEGSWCYDDDPANCEKYGRLYTWAAAQEVCPAGWHLPSKEDFESLLDKVGSSVEERSANLRVSFWSDGKNKYGFSALPAGYYYSFDKEFYNLGDYAYFWSSTEYYEDDAYYLSIYDNYASVLNYDKDGGYSVRCLMDSN